jgi:hypothetical protein
MGADNQDSEMADADTAQSEQKIGIKAKKGIDDSVSSKKKEDFTGLLESSIPQFRDMALKEGNKAQALEGLLGVGIAP